jgi:hypothetical protein
VDAAVVELGGESLEHAGPVPGGSAGWPSGLDPALDDLDS